MGSEMCIRDSSYTLSNLTEGLAIFLSAEASDGCRVSQYVYVQLNDWGVEAQIVPQWDYQVCVGGNVSFSASDEYTDVTWFLENTGETLNGNDVTISDIQDYLTVQISASKGDGCNYMQYVYIYPNFDSFYDDNMVPASIISDRKCHIVELNTCLLYTSPSPRDLSTSRMPSSA